MTLIVHRTPVHRPHPFASHRLQRILPSGRGIHRMAVPAVLEARQRLGATRTASSLPAVASDYVERPVRQWPWTLATVAILLLIVAACARVAL